jgi:hypothetical protein
MMSKVVTRGLQVALAAGLMRAGVAVACPSPPDTPVCTEPPSGEVSACPEIVPESGLVVAVAGAEQATPGGPFVVKVPGAWHNSRWWCDDLALFDIGDLTMSLPGAGVTPNFTDVRIIRVDRASMAAYPNYWAVRYGSGAFCLWAADYGYDRVYDVTVQAWDDATDKLYEGVARIQVACVDPGTTSFPASRIIAENSCSAAAEGPCFADVGEPPAGVCQANGNPDCVPGAEGEGCGGDTGGGTGGGGTGGDTGGGTGGGTVGGTGGGSTGGDTGGGDTGSGGSVCVPVEGHGCGVTDDGTVSDASGSSGSSASADSSSASSEGTSGAPAGAGTAPKGGCSAFPLADPSLGALVLLGLGLLRRRRSK